MGKIFDNRFTIDAYRGRIFVEQLASAERLLIAFAAYEAACEHCDTPENTIILRQGTRVVRRSRET